jgi:alpha-L-fucosidase
MLVTGSIVGVLAAAAAPSPPPCPIVQQANVASGTSGLQNGTSSGAILFLGSAVDCAGCQAACAGHIGRGCHSWVWWYPDEPVPGKSNGCYGRTDNHWPPAEGIPRSHHHVCSGMNCGNPPSGKAPPPPPAPPTGPVAIPTKAQLAWQDREVGAMITFNMQTYGFLPIGTKRAAPPASAFNPDKLDTDNWVQAAKSFGAKYAVLTASHRSGFALWPTKSHNYSVASSPFRRDIMREFVDSCRKFGLAPGVFWTQRFNDYFGVANNGQVNPTRAVQPVSQAEYDNMMSTQLTELAAYGISEFWVNGKIDESPSAVLAKQLARLFPNATCHSCAGVPTKSQIRWVGTGEAGIAAQPSWSGVNGVNGTTVPVPTAGHHGDPHGSMYSPPSCDAVLREHCWFGGRAYPPGHCKLSSTQNLVRKYLTSVGRNCNLILNIAPDTHGVVGPEEIAAYDAMGKAVSCLFSAPIASTTAASLPMNLSSGVIEWLLPGAGVATKGGNFSLVLEEDLTNGQLIGDYSLLCRSAAAVPGTGTAATGASWHPCPMGSLSGAIESTLYPGIGHKRILLLALVVPLDGLRLLVRSNFATGAQIPTLRRMALHHWSRHEGDAAQWQGSCNLKSDDDDSGADGRVVSLVELSGRGPEECVITDAPFSAIPDNATVNTAAIQRAIDACHAAHPGGARVVVPAGAFKTGAILLRSNMELHLAKGAGLYGSSDPNDYPLLKRALPFGDAMWQALVSGYNLTNVSITGENAQVPGSDSIIDGVGWWWNCLYFSSHGVAGQSCIPNRAAAPYCKAFNPTNQTVEAVTAACGGPTGKAALRPKLIEFFNCTGVKLADFTAQNAMCWTIHPTFSFGVTIQRLTVLGAREIGGVSGIEHDSCVDCLVEDTHVDIGDDGITIKSNNFSHWGVTGLTSSRNVTVRRCTVLSRNICLGASTSGGISGAVFEDLVLGDQTTPTLPWAIKFKISSGFIEDVAFRRISIGPVGDTEWMYPNARWSALMIDFDDTRPTNATPPHLWARGVVFEDITVVSEKAPSHISGPDTCLEGLTLRNVTLGGSKRWLGCQNVDLSSLTADDVSPPLTCTGCSTHE